MSITVVSPAFRAWQRVETGPGVAPTGRGLEAAVRPQPPVVALGVDEADVLEAARHGIAGVGRDVASDEHVAGHARLGEERAQRRLADPEAAALDAPLAVLEHVVAQ